MSNLKTPLSRLAVRMVVDADGRVIVGLSMHSDTEAIKELIRRANLHDEMVAALKAVVAVADRKTDEFDMARAAIAKAEGR